MNRALAAFSVVGWVVAAVAALWGYREWVTGWNEGRAEGLYDGRVEGRRAALDELLIGGL